MEGAPRSVPVRQDAVNLDGLRDITSQLAQAADPRESLTDLLGLIASTARGRAAILMVSTEEMPAVARNAEIGSDGVALLSESAGVVCQGPVADAIRDWEGAAEPFLTDDGARLILPLHSGGLMIRDPGCGVSALPAQLAYLRLLVNLARSLVVSAARIARAVHREEELQATRHRLREQAILLRDLAVVDELTAVYNRRFFDCRLTYELDSLRRYKRPVSLVLLDVDRFKAVNDTYGHQVGDGVLQHLAQMGQAIIRRVDLFARFGGEEFAMLLPGTDGPGAVKAAERFRALVEATPAVVGDLTISLTVSAGVVGASGAWEGDEQGLIRAADRALYQAKHQGRNCVVLSAELVGEDPRPSS